MIIEILSTGTLLAHLTFLILAFLLAVDYFFELEEILRVKASIFGFIGNNYRELAFLHALTAVSGSLYMSQIAGISPCELCWHQRILIFPTVPLIGVAIFLNKDDLADYLLPLMIIGIPLSLYHYFIQMTQASTGCSTAVSCSTAQILEYGYISVPMMSLTFFVVTTLLISFEYRRP